MYGPSSIHVGKTLKMLGLNFMGKENEELREKVENLEKMVKVNKEIMSSLLAQEC